MFATGFGIAAMIPHVKKLIYGNILGKGFIRRIRLVWQVENSNLRKGIDTFINDLLFADASEDSYVLSISIYDPTWKIEESLGEHQRVTILPGPLDIDEVIRSEATAKFITDSKLKKNFTQAGGRTLVLMSGSGAMRDSVRRVTRNYLTKGFELRELDYQPET
ncbi:cell surface metalloreductase (FreA) [Ilyonectria robusta]